MNIFFYYNSLYSGTKGIGTYINVFPVDSQ